MATKVITVSVCDRCGLRDEREGAEGQRPPPTWAEVTIQWRVHSGPGGRRETATLCPTCAAHVDGEMVTPPPRAAPKDRP